ncbi:MAG: hypothetical protein WC422_01900 [Candidatus Paceibacterota bacterium]
MVICLGSKLIGFKLRVVVVVIVVVEFFLNKLSLSFQIQYIKTKHTIMIKIQNELIDF